MTERKRLSKNGYIQLIVMETIQEWQAIEEVIQAAQSAVKLSGKLHGEKGLFNKMAGGTEEGRRRVVQTELWQLAEEKMRGLRSVEISEAKRIAAEIEKRTQKRSGE